jgi:hypothetical protein
MNIASQNNERTYILMSGWARSGANLSSSIINAHSEISFSVDVVKYLNFCYKRYPIIDQNNLRVVLKEMHLRLKSRFSINLDIDYCIKDIGDNTEHSHIYMILMDHIVGHNSDQRIIGEYEGVVWGKIPYFLENIKNSKAMMVVRDPRDVLVSFKKNTIAPDNDYLISVFNSLSLMESCIKYEKLYSGNFFGIRFEELKRDTELVVRNITDFLDVDFEPLMLDDRKWTKLRENRWKEWENHDSSSFAEDSKLKKSPVGRWRDLIDPLDHFICEWIAGDVMQLFNMELEFSHPTDELFESALKKLMSSPLLKSSFLDYVYYKKGSEKYPLDPCNPNNWDKRHIDNIDLLGL